MKKMLSWVCGFTLVFALQTIVAASTIGVNVGKGYSVSVENENLDQNALKITGSAGINDRFLVRLGYITEDTDPATPFVGLRYELQKNLAGTLEYNTNDAADTLIVGLRAKKDFSKTLALVGKAEYSNVQQDSSDSYSGYELTGQAEYAFSPMFTGTLGIAYTDANTDSDADPVTTLLAGIELYPTNRLSCWVDYSQSDKENEDAKVGAGVEFKF